MKFLLITIGSHGDVHPFVGLGAGLRARGHEVMLATNGHFASLAKQESLGFTELGTETEFLEGTKDKQLWNRKAGFKAVFGMVEPLTERGYHIVASYVQKNPGAVVIASSLAFGARIARDKFRFPLMSVHLQPSLFRSFIDPPTLPGLFMPAWMPDALKRATWWLGDLAVIDPVVAPHINALRASLGLSAVKHVLRDWWHSPDVVVGLFPQWFALKQTDWPAQTVLTGFPLYDEAGHAPISSALQAFLDAGEAPIAFTPGSAMRFGTRFFEAAIDGCGRINRRALLLTRHAEQLPLALPDHVLHVDYAPFSELLPRCAALVNHGGIGTTAQGLRAGVPQLIMPLAHDQPDNARRLQTLNVGDELRPRRFTGRNVAEKLRRLLTDDDVRRACEAIKRRFDGVDGIGQTCDLAEAMSTRSN